MIQTLVGSTSGMMEVRFSSRLRLPWLSDTRERVSPNEPYRFNDGRGIPFFVLITLQRLANTSP